MSGCGCGQTPIVLSSTPVPARVDVETLLLCDVLPDGTVAGLALVEPIYDTNSGARVGTRIVDPTTGATYTPAGTLGVCGSSSDRCARQISTRTRCDDTNADGTGDVTYVEVWALDPCDGGAPQLLGTYRDGDFAQPYTPTAPADCPDATADTPVVLGTVCYDAGGGATRTAAVLKCAACGDPAVTYLDAETGATLTAPTIVPCPAAADRSTQLLCDVQADGSSVPFLRTYTSDGTVTTTADTLLDGIAPYTPTGTVGVCLPVNDCASPTTPTATIGLCLADGTPIAVTVVRDCSGAVTSEGWINLTTGAFTAGPPPAGTVACGDSRSIQVSGTFCDVDAAGNVVGLVLVEYQYAPDGSIESVRLVDATTGQTYTPQGTITMCPAEADQPEQDVVQLCDTATDGTVTPFIRDFRRDEQGAVTGHSDYLLDGTAYTPTGTVGLCPSPCRKVETLLLCDVQPTPNQPNGQATVPFLRHLTYGCDGAATATTDTGLDGVTPYTVTGTVGVCDPATPAGADVETIPLCLIDSATGDVLEHVRAELVYDSAGARIDTRYVDAVTGDPVTVPAGARLDVCPAPDGCARQILERCGCDTATTGEVIPYTELWAVDPCNGEPPVLLGTYRDGDLTQPYTPVNPGECPASLPDEPEPLHTGVRRLSGDDVLNLTGLHPGLQSATLTVLAGQGTVTTDDGTETIPAGVTLTWSVSNDSDQALTTWTGGSLGAGSDVLLHFTYRG